MMQLGSSITTEVDHAPRREKPGKTAPVTGEIKNTS